MRSTTSRYWIVLAAVFATVLALPMRTASARTHSTSHHRVAWQHSWRHSSQHAWHHRTRLASAHRRRPTRPFYASAEQQYGGQQYPAGSQFQNAPFASPHYSFGGPAAALQWNSQASFGGSSFGANSGGNAAPGSAYQGLVAEQASANGVPASLVHRVIMRESRYNPRAVSRGNYGIMQIRLGTARAMGYAGSAAGLLDPAVNMTYAVRYLAGAYRAAGGNENRAVALYARGYYQEAKAQGFSPYGSQGFSPYNAGPATNMAATPRTNTLYAWATPSNENPVLVRVRHHRHRTT